MRIELAVDTHEAENFQEWLISRGHEAAIGTTTGTYIDGVGTSHDELMTEIAREMWDEYCLEETANA